MTGETIELRREPILNELHAFKGCHAAGLADGILLTGPTAFVGGFVLRELLARWQGEIHCLIRAKSLEHAVQRVKDVARRWSVGPLDLRRVCFHLGDCLAPRWGLSDDSFRQIQEKVGTVVHLALMARWDLPYSYYRRHWIPELARMIEFCGDPEQPKSLHYPCSYNSHFLTRVSDFARLDSSAWFSGYTAFKWVAERVVRHAFGGNLAGSLYDIPLVVGAEDTGLCPPRYSARQILNIFVETGIALDFEFRIITVDWLAKIMVHNMLAEKEGRGLKYVRPVFPDPLDLSALLRTIAPARPFEPGKREDLLARSKNRTRAEFILPPDFGRIITNGHALAPILPPTFDVVRCPKAYDVFRTNIRVWMQDIATCIPGKVGKGQSP